MTRNERVARALHPECEIARGVYQDGSIDIRVPGETNWRNVKYEHDLNDCQEIIAEVERRGMWSEFCIELGKSPNTSRQIERLIPAWKAGIREGLLATPAQLCDAFLKCVEPEGRAALGEEQQRG